MKNDISVISCFDGLGGAYFALDKLGININKYYAFENEKNAVKIASQNHSDIIHLGDINNWKFHGLMQAPDLIVAGSPCQGFSIAGKRLNFDDPRSKLFFVFVDLLNYWKQRNQEIMFLFENVNRMNTDVKNEISRLLGVEPIMINSALVSAQNRERLYWTNIKGVEQPADKGILLRDIVFNDVFPVALHNIYGGFNEKSVRVFEEKSPTIRTSSGGGHIPSFVKKTLIHSEKAIAYMNRKVADGRTHWDFSHHSDVRNDKSSAVVANFFKGVPYNVFKDWDCIRKFHPVECERLQGLPDHTTEGVSATQRYKMIGNGFQIDTIAHILSFHFK